MVAHADDVLPRDCRTITARVHAPIVGRKIARPKTRGGAARDPRDTEIDHPDVRLSLRGSLEEGRMHRGVGSA